MTVEVSLTIELCGDPQVSNDDCPGCGRSLVVVPALRRVNNYPQKLMLLPVPCVCRDDAA